MSMSRLYIMDIVLIETLLTEARSRIDATTLSGGTESSVDTTVINCRATSPVIDLARSVRRHTLLNHPIPNVPNDDNEGLTYVA